MCELFRCTVGFSFCGLLGLMYDRTPSELNRTTRSLCRMMPFFRKSPLMRNYVYFPATGLGSTGCGLSMVSLVSSSMAPNLASLYWVIDFCTSSALAIEPLHCSDFWASRLSEGELGANELRVVSLSTKERLEILGLLRFWIYGAT